MAEMQRGDDPADFGVPEVNKYLESADAEERDRVLAAEEEGKNRSTVKAPDNGDGDGDGDGVSGDVRGGGDFDAVQAAGVEVQEANVTSATTYGPVPPGYGQAEVNDSAESEEFEEPETHDDGEQAAVERTMAQKVGEKTSDDEGSE